MGATVSRSSFDYKECVTVPVIAGFDSNGIIIPIYVRIDGSKYKVDEYSAKTKFSGVTEYRCIVSFKERTMPLELTYYSNESVWTIPKR